MICQKCGLTEATVHRKSVVLRQTIEEHLCVLCAGGLGAPAVMESSRDKSTLINQELPWRLVSEAVHEKQEARFDEEGRKLLRSMIAMLLEKAGRAVSLNISFVKHARRRILMLSAQNPQAMHLELFNRQPETDVRNRGDIFFSSLGDLRWGPPVSNMMGGWKWEMPHEGEAIAATCIRLFTEVFSLTSEDLLKFDLKEWFEVPPRKQT